VTPGALGFPGGMSEAALTVDFMSLPLTRSAPWTDIPAGVETLFPELPSSGARPVEVTVTLPGIPHAMHLVVAQGDTPRALTFAFGACEGVDDFEITARRFRG
jgi:hypothetical protein